MQHVYTPTSLPKQHAGVRVRKELNGFNVSETQLQRVSAEVIRVIGGHVVHTPTFLLHPLHTRHARFESGSSADGCGASRAVV